MTEILSFCLGMFAVVMSLVFTFLLVRWIFLKFGVIDPSDL